MARHLSNITVCLQVFVAEGQFGRGLFTACQMGSNTSGLAGRPEPVALSVDLVHTLCVVKNKDPFYQGQLTWHGNYLQRWQLLHSVSLPDPLLATLHDEAQPDLLRCVPVQEAARGPCVG